MGKKIVIADDEPITIMDISEILTEEGYNVVAEVSDGFDAIEACRQHKPDLALLDIKMPLLNGIKAARIIKEEELAETIVFLTAYSNKDFISQAKEVGIMGYLVKPVDKASLLPVIELAIAKGEEMVDIKENIKVLKSKLEKRKLISRAKGILMDSEGLSEEEAYNKIRKLSMDKRCSMKEIAHVIIINNNCLSG
ncbi:ANTAR domain-containing response regulator [Halanaerobium congolense]|jgi:response regulator NasT|uniref:ANTAR domain-containing response regulator n=1 Tax=Halanaerobium congolense TaxID=54121 RepID=UPI00086E9D50|nr:response regulator [Halanaerobium congolense]OEG63730.1 MAG: Fis family transcriptional regulator [Halanaerobium sp. MDAL1]SDH08830.1 response regulator receiver and ANTAR domain protein [Halanaerobium congolense]SHM96961.1 response regulator receiver and ANTAR domain protein [Halanaerobium congolense]